MEAELAGGRGRGPIGLMGADIGGEEAAEGWLVGSTPCWDGRVIRDGDGWGKGLLADWFAVD